MPKCRNSVPLAGRTPARSVAVVCDVSGAEVARLADPLDAPHSLRALSGPLPPAIADWENVHARRAMLRREGWTPESRVVVVYALTGADPADVHAGRRMPPVSRARAIVAHIACDHLAWPTVKVAATVGASGPAVSQARSRGSAALVELGAAAWDLVLRSRRGAS